MHSQLRCGKQEPLFSRTMLNQMPAEKAQDPATPLHAIFGGGDQLYNDNVWALPELDAWLQLPKDERLGYEPTAQDAAAVEEFYRTSYVRHVHFHPAAMLLRSLPQVRWLGAPASLPPLLPSFGSASIAYAKRMQVNTWDDHDIFDGWGSYPAAVQTCPMFQMVFSQAQRFYLLCQHATTAEHAAADGYLVLPASSAGHAKPAAHFVSQLGPRVFVIAPDSRSQRSRERIIPQESMDHIKVAVRTFSFCSCCALVVALSACFSCRCVQRTEVAVH